MPICVPRNYTWIIVYNMLTRQIYGLFVWHAETTITCILIFKFVLHRTYCSYLMMIFYMTLYMDNIYCQYYCLLFVSVIVYQYSQLIYILHIDYILPAICSSDGNVFQRYVILWLSSCCILAFAMAKSVKRIKWTYAGSVNGKSAWNPKFLSLFYTFLCTGFIFVTF